MSQRSTSPLSRSTVRRTLQRFWGVTRTQPLIVFLSVFSSAGYIFLLTFANTYVMALIVDRVQAGPVAGDQVFEVFGPISWRSYSLTWWVRSSPSYRTTPSTSSRLQATITWRVYASTRSPTNP